jgi:hypothetical protein
VAQAPSPGLACGAVTLTLARLALACGPRALRDFLAGVERAADLALAALAAQDALLPPRAVRAALRHATGLPDDALPAHHRLGLCGWAEAASVLLGDGARARENRLDLAAALGERLAAVRARHASLQPVVLAPAGAVTRERLGRLDLQAFPDARDRLPLAGQREGFRYDGAVPLAPGADAAAVGRLAAGAALRLGLAGEAPAPRSLGSVEQRVEFLQAWARTIAPRRDPAPCG